MKIKYLFFIFFTSIFISAKAEIIDGPANLRIQPRGGTLVSLNGGTEVTCFPLKNGWFKISFDIKITKQQYDKWMQQYPKGHTIKAGEKLYDLHNKFIGVATVDISDSLTIAETYGGVRSPASYDMEIIGYVARTNIKTNSIAENVLDSVFIKKVRHLEFDTLKSFINDQKYKNQNIINKVLPKFNEYCIYESEDNSAGYRIGLIFENTDLIAIEHSRPINIVNVGRFKEYQLAHGNKILVIKSPKSLLPSALMNKINEIFQGAD